MSLKRLALSFAAMLLMQTEAAAEVLPADVAASAQRHYPEVIATLAERDAAAGGRLSAAGAFDTVFKTEATTWLEGFYSGDTLSTGVEKQLGPLGAKVYGGYRVSDGDFPIYEDINFTNRLGEAKIGVLFSLLRDRTIDKRRLDVRQADLSLLEADLDVFLTRIGVQRRALVAYWRWVAAGRELQAYQDILRIAEERDRALRLEVSAGARAQIVLTENAQNLTRRREFVRGAERDLALAANALGLFLRDDDGTMIVPTADDLPGTVAINPLLNTVEPEAIAGQRPEFRLLQVAEERIENRRELARNDLRPRFDITVEASDDFGAIGAGGVSRDPGELKAGATFTVPLGRRNARGRIQEAEAELRALRQRQRLLRDQIVRELNDISTNLDTAKDLLSLTRQEVGLADTMRRAEAERFRGGASDFFLVNLREETFADARVKLARAEFALAAANITYRAAIMDTDALGLQ
ncbi:MAG: TolC family protein [Pseudomonadota bacterium]